MAALLLLGAAGAIAAGGRFSLVIGGKIRSVESIDGGSAGKMVHVRAVAEMARESGAGVRADAESGIVSVTRGDAASGVEDSFQGFTRGVTFVVDGKITKVASKVHGGAPYVAAKDLKRVAVAMGFEADLDVGAGVLALTGGRSGAGAAPSAGGAPPGDPVATDLMGIVASAAAGTGLAGGARTAPPHDGSVCGYLDSQKSLWLGTEPSSEEKETLRRLADEFDRGAKAKRRGNLADLALFERTLRGFDEKVQARLAGTRDLAAPTGARDWQRTAVQFLEKTSETLALSFDLIRVMKLPEAEQDKELDAFKKGIEKLKKLDSEHKALGTIANDRIVDVRKRNRCGPA